MRRTLRRASSLALLTLLALSGVAAQAQERGGEPVRRPPAPRKRFPRFADYPARESFSGKPAPARIDTPRARMFRTRLREDSAAGPNFGGRYTVVYWGCGTGCAQFAVVDARTGRVHFIPLEYADIPDEETGPGWRRDSRLLVLTRTAFGDHYGAFEVWFYEMTPGGPRLLRKARGDDSNPVEK